MLTISKRLSNPDGTFAGIVVASLNLSYFLDLFKDVALGPNSNVTLSRLDGVVLMRWPFKREYIGSNISNAKIYQYLLNSRSGRFETKSVTDGVHRLVAYSQIGDLPLVIGVGQSTADIFAAWWKFAALVGAMVALLCVITAGLAAYLVREFKRRRAAEATLAQLAMSDSLTELANRRHFQFTLDREWARAARARTSLSLMMIDADHFKRYNDSHGHQAGDRLLKTIAASIAESGERGECAARYGGDEFVVLMPSAGTEAARQAADRIRKRFDLACRKNDIEAAGLSIGIASAVPQAGATSADLLAATDQALYRAKTFGRGRTEVEHHQLGHAA